MTGHMRVNGYRIESPSGFCVITSAIDEQQARNNAGPRMSAAPMTTTKLDEPQRCEWCCQILDGNETPSCPAAPAVQDELGREIELGATVWYGSQPDQPCTVAHISSPDIIEDDERGAVADVVYVTVRFPDGSSDVLQARNITPSTSAYWGEDGYPESETTWEVADIEVPHAA